MQDKRKTGSILVIVGSGLLVVGALLPWASVTSFFGTISAAGTEGDGVLTLGIGIIGLVLGLIDLNSPRETLLWLMALVGLAGGGIALYDIINVSEALSDANASGAVRASVGMGLWLTLAAGLLVIVGAFMAMAAKPVAIPAPAPPPPPTTPQ